MYIWSLRRRPSTYESEIGYKLTSEDGATLKRLSEWLEAKAIGVDSVGR